ncbi:MAG: substrate-binding domain-containing protein [Thermodesulfobacteriota bacterium]
MRRILAAAALFLALAAHPAFAGGLDGFKGLSGEIRVAGSEAGFAAFREAADRVMAAYPGVKITFTLNGAGMGLARLRMGQADLSLYDRAPGLASKGGEPLEFIPFGVDPVAVVLSPANPARELTVEQVRGLFSGTIANWKQAGGGDYLVVPIYIEASEEIGKPETRPGTVSVSSQPAMRFNLMRFKQAIAFSSVRDLDGALKPAVLDGQAPTMEAFKAGRYRVYRILHAAARKSRTALVQAFLDYMTGPEGQALMEKTGYLPLASKPDFQSQLPVDIPDELVKRTD